jgi:hypothetical protein
MSGIEPPLPPSVPAPLVYPLTLPPRRRSRAPLFIGVGIAASVFALVAAFVFSAAFSGLLDRADLTAAERAVKALDAAYANGDCDAFEAVTTDDARGDILGKNYDCDAFEAAAEALVDGDEYAYSVSVLRSAKFDDEIVVKTRESFGDETPERYSYVLVNEGAGWVIDKYGRD